MSTIVFPCGFVSLELFARVHVRSIMMSVLMTTRYGAIVYVCKIVQFVVCLLFIVYRWLLYVFLLLNALKKTPVKCLNFTLKHGVNRAVFVIKQACLLADLRGGSCVRTLSYIKMRHHCRRFIFKVSRQKQRWLQRRTELEV